jgi:hypothetical protein
LERRKAEAESGEKSAKACGMAFSFEHSVLNATSGMFVGALAGARSG